MKFLNSHLIAFLLPALVDGRLSGSVGPTTSTAQKRLTKQCNILDYGGFASEGHDNGPAISSAWAACKSGGEVYIPSGNYGMATWVKLNGGTAVSIRLDGVIYRTGTGGGHMFKIEHSTDFELYSSTSEGAIQGYGYYFHKSGTYGPRIMRLVQVTNFSVHDVAFVDSGSFHLILDSVTNGEVYNVIIRGGNEGGLDGIDVWGLNVWIHDVEVTNKDECVTIKNPSSYMLIENVYCNWSGGSAMGSLGADVDIHHIAYNNVYTVNSNHMFLFKSYGGSGSVYDVTLSNFIGHKNAYSLYLNGYWTSQAQAPGNGVLYHDITFSNWTGTCSDGSRRGPIQITCPDGAPCYNVVLQNIDIGTETGSVEYYNCESAYGNGACLKSGSYYSSYTVVTETISSSPSRSNAPTMPNDLTAGFGLSQSIPIPTVPSSYYPGATPIKAKLG